MIAPGYLRGCGLGEDAIFLAERGFRVAGFDAALSAIMQAREFLERQGADTLGPMNIDIGGTDECRRITVPVWQLHASRQ